MADEYSFGPWVHCILEENSLAWSSLTFDSIVKVIGAWDMTVKSHSAAAAKNFDEVLLVVDPWNNYPTLFAPETMVASAVALKGMTLWV